MCFALIASEMGANIMSVLHASPATNAGLRTTVTSSALKDLGKSIYEVWDQIAPEKRFCHIDSENLIDVATSESTPAGFDKWAEWMKKRYC